MFLQCGFHSAPLVPEVKMAKKRTAGSAPETAAPQNVQSLL